MCRLTWGAAALALAAGCTARDTIAVPAPVGDDLPTYCAGRGASRLVDGTCAGELAETLFHHAVCGCAALSFGVDLTTDGFDSRTAPYAGGGAGGDVASNVGLDASLAMDVGGDVTVAGEGVEAGTRLKVAGDLTCGGPLGRPGSVIEVEGAAAVAGDVTVASLAVGGALVTAPGAVLSGDITAPVQEEAAVEVPPPCRCDALDVAAVVADHALTNHDDEIGLDPRGFAAVDREVTLELPCGRFYLDEIAGGAGASLTLRATGRTSLFIGGNVTLPAGLRVELDPGAELDLFVAGYIQTVAPVVLGDPARPRALRIAVASDGSISLPEGSTLAANLFAPASDLAAPGSLEVFGSLVVRRVNAGGSLAIHRDRAVSHAAEDCAN